MIKYLSNRKFTICTLWIFATVIIVYAPILFHQNVANPDHGIVVDPLRSISSLSDYINSLFDHKIWDVQPIRDLSLFFDITIEKIFNIKIFIWHNVTLWALCCISFYFIIRKLNISDKIAVLTATLMSCYPSFVWAISWISARKHILALLFILLATNHLINLVQSKKKRYSFICTIFYALSIFSQPITVMWVLLYFLVLIKYFPIKKSIILSAPIIGFAVLCLSLNWYWYSFIFPDIAQIVKSGGDNTFGLKLLILGRSIYQIILPHKFAFSYAPQAVSNLVGLSLLPILIYICSKIISKKLLYYWPLYCSLPFLVLLPKVTMVFLFDCYLLVPLTGYFFFISLLLKKIEHKQIILISCFGILYCASIIKSNYETRFFKSTHEYFKISNFREPSCVHHALLAKSFALIKKYDELDKLVITMLKKNCQIGNKGVKRLQYTLMISEAIAFNKYLPLTKKMKYFNKYQEKSSHLQLAKAIAYIRDGQTIKGLNIAQKTFKQPLVIPDGPSRSLLYIKDVCFSKELHQCHFILRRLNHISKKNDPLSLRLTQLNKFEYNYEKRMFGKETQLYTTED